jgi:hypothetical protein
MVSGYDLIALFFVLFLGSRGEILSEENTENMYTTQHDATTQYLRISQKLYFVFCQYSML